MKYESFFHHGLSDHQLELSNELRLFWMEHVLWTRLFIVSAAFLLPDLSFVTKRLLQNPVDFADALHQFYGQHIAARFEELLRDHLLIAAQLVNAAKVGNTTEVNRQRDLWYANAEDIARFLASINSFWSMDEWRELFSDHLHMTENEAVYILTKQYQHSIKEYQKIESEALQMADLMTYGLIRQFDIQ